MFYTDKLVITSSKWGNLFNHRYYINGYRVKEQVWRDYYTKLNPDNKPATASDNTYSHFYRKTWQES